MVSSPRELRARAGALEQTALRRAALRMLDGKLCQAELPGGQRAAGREREADHRAGARAGGPDVRHMRRYGVRRWSWKAHDGVASTTAAKPPAWLEWDERTHASPPLTGGQGGGGNVPLPRERDVTFPPSGALRRKGHGCFTVPCEVPPPPCSPVVRSPRLLSRGPQHPERRRAGNRMGGASARSRRRNRRGGSAVVHARVRRPAGRSYQTWQKEKRALKVRRWRR